MHAEDLHCLYRQLRIELEAAYAARPLDPALIDRIAQDMLPLEAELAAQGTATLERFVARPEAGEGDVAGAAGDGSPGVAAPSAGVPDCDTAGAASTG